MSVIRVNKTKNYTVMSNYHITDKRLSLKAKGLLSVMLSLPDDWNYSTLWLATICADGTDSVRSGLQELEKCGYLVRTLSSENGKFNGYIYDIFEQPCEINSLSENIKSVENFPSLDFPTTGNPTTEKPMTENPTQQNTNKENTCLLKNYIKNKLKSAGAYVGVHDALIDEVVNAIVAGTQIKGTITFDGKKYNAMTFERIAKGFSFEQLVPIVNRLLQRKDTINDRKLYIQSMLAMCYGKEAIESG